MIFHYIFPEISRWLIYYHRQLDIAPCQAATRCVRLRENVGAGDARAAAPGLLRTPPTPRHAATPSQRSSRKPRQQICRLRRRTLPPHAQYADM